MHRHPFKAGPSRRSVLAGSAALAGLAASGVGLTPSRAQARNRGGTVRVAMGHGSTSDTLDPAVLDNAWSQSVAIGSSGYLTAFAGDGSVVPDVAESWEASPDAKVWRFKLRSGVTFHDGRSVTAQDVVNSLQYHMGEDSTSVAKPLLAGIKGMKADGDVAEIELESGNADFPGIVTDYHLPIKPPGDDRGIDWRSGVGCGAYKVVEFKPGVSATLARNENDWNQDRGFFEAAEVLSVVDANARTAALVAGDVHVADRLDLKTVGLLARNSELKIHSVAGNQHYTFPMSCNKEPFNDVNVRLALKFAINRQELVDKILFGYGSVGNDVPIGRGQRYFNSEMPQTEYDPDKAKFYLKQSGRDSLSVTLSAADAAFAGAVDAAVLYQNSAKGAGIDLTVNRMPNDGYWSDVWMKHAFSACYWGGRPIEDAMFSTAYSAGAAWNDTFWENARFNELLVAARAELDDAKRRAMYYEMQLILNQDGGALIPMFANYVFATRNEVETSAVIASNADMDGLRWMERWSFR